MNPPNSRGTATVADIKPTDSTELYFFKPKYFRLYGPFRSEEEIHAAMLEEGGHIITYRSPPSQERLDQEVAKYHFL